MFLSAIPAFQVPRGKRVGAVVGWLASFFLEIFGPVSSSSRCVYVCHIDSTVSNLPLPADRLRWHGQMAATDSEREANQTELDDVDVEDGLQNTEPGLELDETLKQSVDDKVVSFMKGVWERIQRSAEKSLEDLIDTQKDWYKEDNPLPPLCVSVILHSDHIN